MPMDISRERATMIAMAPVMQLSYPAGLSNGPPPPRRHSTVKLAQLALFLTLPHSSQANTHFESIGRRSHVFTTLI